jgi:hypothetical protein
MQDRRSGYLSPSGFLSQNISNCGGWLMLASKIVLLRVQTSIPKEKGETCM